MALVVSAGEGERRTGSSVARGADSGRLHFNRCPARSWAGWWRLQAASFVDAAGAEAARAPAARARRSPAHDLVGQQHATHLRVLVLALVHDGLRGGGGTSRGGGYAAPAAWAPSRPGRCGSPGRQVHCGPGEASRPSQATVPAEPPPRTTTTPPPPGRRARPRPACSPGRPQGLRGARGSGGWRPRRRLGAGSRGGGRRVGRPGRRA